MLPNSIPIRFKTTELFRFFVIERRNNNETMMMMMKICSAQITLFTVDLEQWCITSVNKTVDQMLIETNETLAIGKRYNSR